MPRHAYETVMSAMPGKSHLWTKVILLRSLSNSVMYAIYVNDQTLYVSAAEAAQYWRIRSGGNWDKWQACEKENQKLVAELERQKLEAEQLKKENAALRKVAAECEVSHSHACMIGAIRCAFVSQLSRFQRLRAHAGKLYDMYVDGRASDFTIVCEEQHHAVHMSVLAAHSPVFDRMFFHKDMREMQTGQMELEGASKEALHAFLIFVYKGELQQDLELDTLLEVFVLADRYNVVLLSTACEHEMRDR